MAFFLSQPNVQVVLDGCLGIIISLCGEPKLSQQMATLLSEAGAVEMFLSEFHNEVQLGVPAAGVMRSTSLANVEGSKCGVLSQTFSQWLGIIIKAFWTAVRALDQPCRRLIPESWPS